MRIAVILSAGGSPKNVSGAAARRIIEDSLARAGHAVSVALVSPEDADRAMRKSLEGDAEAVLVGGGNDWVSRATNLLTDTGKALGVLPLGGMSPLAHALGTPPELERAVEALARARVASL
ncbi:MAG TPA: diacylglycerol kinase family protein, partial [Polyangiaceae bacterium]|nr:diacylglycerol kinase family protein [Polyangiaceae bacterium]